jgi:hypothetical protein
MAQISRRAAAIIALSIAGCSEALGPGDVSGSYALYRYDGAAPPRQYVSDRGCTVTVWSGELTLGADSRFSLYVQRSQQCPGGAGAGLEFVDLSLGGTFDLVGAELKLNGELGPAGGLTAYLRGTHFIVQLPQPPGVSPSTVVAEFVAGGDGNRTTQTTTGGTSVPNPPPAPDTGVVIIIRRP